MVRRGFWGAAATATLAVLVACPPGFAAFPGTNGKITFAGTAFPGQPDVFTVNTDGTGLANLTNDGAIEFTPTWSPDGTRVAFTTNRVANFEIWVMNADGSGQTRLTNNSAHDGGPAWSPDGTKIAFESNRDGDFEIWVMNADGSAPAQLTSNPASDASPSWSPNGASIAFTRDSALFTMAANGSGQSQLAACTSCTHHRPDWSPDGQNRILYALEYLNGSGEPAEDLRWRNVSGSETATVATAGEGSLCCLDGHSWSPDGLKVAYVLTGLRLADRDGTNVITVPTGGIQPRDPDWQPAQYARPKGATPLRVSLMVAFPQCTSPNRTHGPPLANPSCGGTAVPPTGASPNVTVGAPDWNGAAANFTGFVRFTAVPGNAGTPQDEADVQIVVQATDIRCRQTNPIAACGADNNGQGRDYTGELLGTVPLRITDKNNFGFPGGGAGQATLQDTPLSFVVPCSQTAGVNTIGSSCSLSTTADAVLPGVVPEQQRMIWEMQQVQVRDGGADGNAGTPGDNQAFLKQGVFVP